MSNFLDVDDSIITRNLLIASSSSLNNGQEPNLVDPTRLDRPLLTPSDRKEQQNCKFIIPQPGLCVKTVDNSSGRKVFINICKSLDVPEPDFDYPDEQIANILSNGTDADMNEIRIPMSIGEAHEEKDNKGNPCVAVEVIVNTTFYEERILASEVYRTFFIVISMEGIDEKHKLNLEKSSYTILSNKKSVGKISPQYVRAKPAIKELASTKSSENSIGSSNRSRKLVEEVATNESQLECDIIQVSSEAARAEIKIPKLRNPKKLTLTLGADRIIVDSPVGSLDVYVPLDIHQEECRAEFNIETEILTIHLPLVEKP